jgi:translation initiation factor 3 subunit H
LGHKTENAFPIEHDLEHCCQWVDDLVEEQNKFQSYLRSIERYKDHLRWHAKRRGENDEDDMQTPLWKSTAEPPRLDSLLIANQIREYCTGINSHATYILSMLQIETIL